MYQLFSLLFYLADTRTRYCLIHEPCSRFVFSQSLEDAGTRPAENVVRISLPKEKNIYMHHGIFRYVLSISFYI